MNIQVLGTGCPKCKQLLENAKKAFPGAKVEKVEDLDKILEAGVMMTPALVVDGKVVSSGKVLSPEDIRKLKK
ncbi:MAG: TM0996/MTH895 family glutaredoxin-like protein [Candidatus Altiarchaeota archaeon]|nr:TM0996/MTH895 family glutaredoxin-like protein [Candidatus Altiarchaeota archaeon]